MTNTRQLSLGIAKGRTLHLEIRDSDFTALSLSVGEGRSAYNPACQVKKIASPGREPAP